MVKALDDLDDFVRLRAVIGLARIDLKKAISVLKTKAFHHLEYRVFLNAVLFVAGNAYDESVSNDPKSLFVISELCDKKEMLTTLKDSADTQRRYHAFKILSLFGKDKELQDIFELALKDPDLKIRQEAARQTGSSRSMVFFHYLYAFSQVFFISYFFLFNSINLFFLLIAFYDVRRRIISRGYEGFDIAMASPFTPPLTIIVPAYNEEKTIVESINSLMNLNFPRFEVVVVNDGSKDATLRVLNEGFELKRIDIDYMRRITTAPVRGLYQGKPKFPERVHRFVVVDKENGGKADALNAGINASFCPYFVSIDADSILDADALLQAFRFVLDRQEIVAIGGQVAVANDSIIKEGKVVEPRLPRKWVVRMQIVEYLRSFTMGRTALSRLQSILIISGVFGIFNKEFVQRAGGYLTRFLTSKITHEYVGNNAETVCEDMEIIVRMQRFIKEKKLDKKILYVPHPLAWTEVPEDLASLSKQRNRWQRGLLETMLFHRKMLFNKNYGRAGLFAFPYFFLFELLGAPVELLGYLTLPVFFIYGNLDLQYMTFFLLVSVAYGIFLSTLSIVLSASPEKTSETDMKGKSLFYYSRIQDLLILFAAGILENVGYRQLTLWWRLKAIFDFFKGKKGWEKFERKGFASDEAPK